MWQFDGGVEVRASSSPHVVRVPFSDPNAVDPEEAFVASLSSCHLLVFLSIAARRGYVVDEYVDDAVGRMEKNEHGKMWISHVMLRPKITFSGAAVPSSDELREMHDEAHHECFIANSVKTLVECA